MNNDVFKKLTDVKLFALGLYGEARGEGLDGMLGVGSVVMNRVKNPCWWGRTVKSVLLKPKQFSCFNEGNPNRAILLEIAKDFDSHLKAAPILSHCLWIARGILNGHLMSNVGRADHYHTRTSDPSWDDDMCLVRTIGNHEFYYKK